VQFDLRPGSANPVFRQLRDLRRAGLSLAYESWSRALGRPGNCSASAATRKEGQPDRDRDEEEMVDRGETRTAACQVNVID
jgi:hypothetical protein